MNVYRRGWALEAEISDLIVDFDPVTLERQPVLKKTVMDYYRTHHNNQALRVVARLPEHDGVLEPGAVDGVLIRCHRETQCISEEFMHGQRVQELLVPLIDALRKSGVPLPMRVVDLGCGTGFVVRWLTAHGGLGSDVELIGVDYNAALIGESERLAAAENLACKFQVVNAFNMTLPVTVFLSTGVLHHFRGPALDSLFKQINDSTATAFIHFDFQSSWLAPIGSWLFHAVRTREPLARHDGVLSAVRAHPLSILLKTAHDNADRFDIGQFDASVWGLPIPQALHALVGIDPACRQALSHALHGQRSGLGSWS